MKSKEDFKTFVKSHPELVRYVKNNEMTWQKFYELYNLYEEDNNIWKDYINNDNINNNNETFNSQTKVRDISGISEIANMLKNIKPESIQQNITSIQKFLGFISDFIGDSNKDNEKPKSIYTPRPTHKMFED